VINFTLGKLMLSNESAGSERVTTASVRTTRAASHGHP